MTSAAEVMVEQRTPEWHLARAGKITASSLKHVMAFSKRDGKPLQARADYLVELATERLTGKSQGIPMSTAMQYGVDVEPAARSAYEARHGIIVKTPGFIVMGCGYIGCSPDGLVPEVTQAEGGAKATLPGGVEIKCPFNASVHIDTVLNGMPEEHIPQVQGSMMVTGYQWWDFVSYDPRLTGRAERLGLYVQRIPRDQAYIDLMLERCEEMNADADALVGRLLEAAGGGVGHGG